MLSSSVAMTRVLLARVLLAFPLPPGESALEAEPHPRPHHYELLSRATERMSAWLVGKRAVI